MLPFAPETVDLPDPWPACKAFRCGSRAACAHIDVALGPVTVTCENGHFRAYRALEEFRAGGRYAGLFTPAATGSSPAPDAPERRADAGVRRRTEVLDDAERCALCGVPPAEHPLRPEDGPRSDRALWAWLRRWRPAGFVELANALAPAGATEPRAAWRLALPAAVRERVVDALRSSALVTDQVVAPARLAAIAPALTRRELEVGAGLLFAACSACAEVRRAREPDAAAYVRTYVDALYDGDERRARGDAARWRTVQKIAHAAAAHDGARARSA